jgi:hypothetical protein
MRNNRCPHSCVFPVGRPFLFEGPGLKCRCNGQPPIGSHCAKSLPMRGGPDGSHCEVHEGISSYDAFEMSGPAFLAKARSLSLPRQSTVPGIAYLHPPDDPPSLCADMDWHKHRDPRILTSRRRAIGGCCRQRSYRLKDAPRSRQEYGTSANDDEIAAFCVGAGTKTSKKM